MSEHVGGHPRPSDVLMLFFHRLELFKSVCAIKGPQKQQRLFSSSIFTHPNTTSMQRTQYDCFKQTNKNDNLPLDCQPEGNSESRSKPTSFDVHICWVAKWISDVAATFSQCHQQPLFFQRATWEHQVLSSVVIETHKTHVSDKWRKFILLSARKGSFWELETFLFLSQWVFLSECILAIWL